MTGCSTRALSNQLSQNESFQFHQTCPYTHPFCVGFLPSDVLFSVGRELRKDGKNYLPVMLSLNVYSGNWPFGEIIYFLFFCLGNTLKNEINHKTILLSVNAVWGNLFFCFVSIHLYVFCLFVWLLFSCIGYKVHMIVGFGDFSPASLIKEVRTWENTHKEVKRLSLTWRNRGLYVREHPRNFFFFFDGFRVKETVILWTRRMEGFCLTLL